MIAAVTGQVVALSRRRAARWRRDGRGLPGRGYAAGPASRAQVLITHACVGSGQPQPSPERSARRAALRSPAIAVTYDIGEHQGTAFIVMEYVSGELLSARLSKGKLDPQVALDITAQVADALDEAHAAGIVHRDIKSANLMLDGRGRVKVLDFGLARFLESRDASKATTMARVTSPGVVLGTVSYMAPEQALGRRGSSRRSLFARRRVLRDAHGQPSAGERR